MGRVGRVGSVGRWGDGEMGRWGDGEIFIKGNYPNMIEEVVCDNFVFLNTFFIMIPALVTIGMLNEL